jgi:eukaryotic-like serine/threonine-protein kinase
VWDATTGAPLLAYAGQRNEVVRAVAWSPNGKYIASGGNDGSVQVWDARTGVRTVTYTVHQTPGHQNTAVKAITWSPNSTRIASGGEDRTVQVWQAI